MASNERLTSAPGRETGVLKRLTRSIRVHHVYFLLAAFDLVAVGTGLYLSHHLNGMLAANVESSVAWGALQREISVLRRGAAAATAPGNDVFASGDLDGELKSWDARAAELEGQLATLEGQVLAGLSGDDRAGAKRHLENLVAAYDGMAASATSLFDLYRRGHHAASAPAVALMNRENGKLIASVDNLSNYLHDVHLARRKAEAQGSSDAQRLEYMIAGMAVLMVCAITLFGHWIGRKFQRQYDALEQAHARQQDLVAQVGASHDDIVSLNAELRALNDGLEERIAARTRELTDANAATLSLNRELTRSLGELEAAQDEIIRRGRMAELGRLTATVAHEIRNPLSAIRTASYFIERRTIGSSLGLDKALERINTSIQRCDTIITQLMDFMSTKELVLQPVPLDDWVRSCVERERPHVSEQIAFVLSLKAPCAVVELDPERMRRLIVNLVANASEAMVGTGEVVRVVEGEQPTIWITTAVRDTEVTLAIADNGPGIAEENLDKVTEPLFTTKNFGVGLGLPAADEIIHMHGGRLEIESKPGKGTRVTARFPTRQAGLEAA